MKQRRINPHEQRGETPCECEAMLTFLNLDRHSDNLYLGNMDLALTPTCPEQLGDLRGLV